MGLMLISQELSHIEYKSDRDEYIVMDTWIYNRDMIWNKNIQNNMGRTSAKPRQDAQNELTWPSAYDKGMHRCHSSKVHRLVMNGCTRGRDRQKKYILERGDWIG